METKDQIQKTESNIATVLSAREKARVEARFILANKFPRDWDSIRVQLLKACRRRGFAGRKGQKDPMSAWYQMPWNDNAEGFSIRFAEECLCLIPHFDVSTIIISDDEKSRTIEIGVADFEKNTQITISEVLEKTKERKTLKKGEKPIGTRINSAGEKNYILPADEADMLQKQNRATSKAMRNSILRLIPSYILAECRDLILKIRNGNMNSKDPDAYKKQIIDGFVDLGVHPDELKEYLGHDIDRSSPAEMEDLRAISYITVYGSQVFHLRRRWKT